MHNSSIPQFIFVGRLSHEKWFDRILEIVDDIITGEIRATLHICGDGVYMNQLLKRPNLGEHGIFVHGFVAADEMNHIFMDSAYMLMPSRFLETFGLSALESITKGVPIIGFAKGGLTQFVSGVGAIVSLDPVGITPLEKADLTDSALYRQRVREICQNFDLAHWQKDSERVRVISRNYSRNIWYTTFLNAVGPLDRILVLTDYSGNIGGIESYTKSMIEELRSRGYSVTMLTSSHGTRKWLRYLGLVGTAFNICFAFRFACIITKQKPQAIWLQSVMRAIGPIGLLPLLWYSWKILITHHDFGLFVPYPTQIHHETQIGEFGWWRFAQDIQGPFSAIAIAAKYVNLLLLRIILRRVTLHCIPSAFLGRSVRSFIGGSSSVAVVVQPHFNPHVWA